MHSCACIPQLPMNRIVPAYKPNREFYHRVRELIKNPNFNQVTQTSQGCKRKRNRTPELLSQQNVPYSDSISPLVLENSFRVLNTLLCNLQDPSNPAEATKTKIVTTTMLSIKFWKRFMYQTELLLNDQNASNAAVQLKICQQVQPFTSKTTRDKIYFMSEEFQETFKRGPYNCFKHNYKYRVLMYSSPAVSSTGDFPLDDKCPKKEERL